MWARIQWYTQNIWDFFLSSIFPKFPNNFIWPKYITVISHCLPTFTPTDCFWLSLNLGRLKISHQDFPHILSPVQLFTFIYIFFFSSALIFDSFFLTPFCLNPYFWRLSFQMFVFVDFFSGDFLSIIPLHNFVSDAFL